MEHTHTHTPTLLNTHANTLRETHTHISTHMQCQTVDQRRAQLHGAHPHSQLYTHTNIQNTQTYAHTVSNSGPKEEGTAAWSSAGASPVMGLTGKNNMQQLKSAVPAQNAHCWYHTFWCSALPVA